MAKIDILMATHNGEKYVREQIESIQGQSFGDWRLLISDDCSSDNTLGIIRELSEEDKRIHVVSEGVRYGSAKSNFMNLLQKSESRYLMFSDQDDVWLPEKIEKSYREIVRLENGTDGPCLFCSNVVVVDEELNVIANSFQEYSGIYPDETALNRLLVRNISTGCTTIFNRKLLSIASKFNTNKYYVMHDWLLAILARSFGKIICSSDPMMLYRQHGSNAAGAMSRDLVSRIKRASLSDRLIVSSIVQASSILDCFQSELPVQAMQIMQEYASLLNKDLYERICTMNRYGFWKRDLAARSAQLICLMRKLNTNVELLV